MSLNNLDKQNIISEFPQIKLSYENNIMHKKVYDTDNNFIMALPHGNKCFAWFTNFNDKYSCIILIHGNNIQNNNNNTITDIKIMNCCFNYELCYGTIFYGTLFKYNNNNYFTIEDIFFYKSNNVSTYSWFNKLKLINDIMSYDIKQVSYNKNFIVFGLPIMYGNLQELNNNINSIKYKINCIQFRNYNKSNVSYNLLYKDIDKFNSINSNKKTTYQQDKKFGEDKKYMKENTLKNKIKREIVFELRPDIQNDIYYLYCFDDNEQTLVNYDIAFIPDYNTSVMMNKLFRNIKENRNLDLLEESDDEEEFENDKQDRYVFLDKKYNMVCNYNYKFKKWYPVKITDSNNLICKKDLQMYEKNKH